MLNLVGFGMIVMKILPKKLLVDEFANRIVKYLEFSRRCT